MTDERIAILPPSALCGASSPLSVALCTHSAITSARFASCSSARYVTKPAESSALAAIALMSSPSCPIIVSQRPRSPESFSSSVCAEPSVSSALARLTLSDSASAVRFEKSARSSTTLPSSIESADLHFSSRSLDDSSSACSWSLASISGEILTSTAEYSRLALTHAASGAAATETR